MESARRRREFARVRMESENRGRRILTLGKDKDGIPKAKERIRQGKDGIRKSEPPNSHPREGWNPARRGKEF